MTMNFRRPSSKSNGLFKHPDPPHSHSTASLWVDNLTIQYESGPALDRVSFQVMPGERLAIVGPNGAGKSTLFKAIAGVLKPNQGTINLYGNDASGHICIAYVPQRSQVDWSFPVTVADVVMMGRIGKLGLFRQPRPADWRQVTRALQVVKLDEMAGRQIGELSGGQQQRMFIARALAQEAELMLMDEPLTGLDTNSQEEFFGILDQLKQREVTVMVALHDLKLAAERFDRVMLLNHRIIGLGKAEEVFEDSKLLLAYEGRLRIIPTDSGELRLGDTCCGEGEEHEHV
jgi:manganese/iron transport system ATP-binding protein